MSTVDVHAAAVAVAAELRSRADEIESLRRLPPDLSARLATDGFYRMWSPTTVGGLELPPVPGLEALEVLARADGSAAW